MGRTPVARTGNNDKEESLHYQQPADEVTALPSVSYQPHTSNLHYEAELVVAIGNSGQNVQTVQEAYGVIFRYALVFDLT